MLEIRVCNICGEKMQTWGTRTCRKCLRGSNHHSAKLTDEIALEVKYTILNTNKSSREIAKEFGVSQACISNINRGENLY